MENGAITRARTTHRPSEAGSFRESRVSSPRRNSSCQAVLVERRVTTTRTLNAIQMRG